MKHLFCVALLTMLSNIGVKSSVSFEGAEFTFVGRRIAKYENVLAGDVITKRISFKNTGNQPLIITGIEKTCTCTSVDYPKHELMPGEEGMIAVTINTFGKIGQDIIVITIHTNDSIGKHIARIDLEIKTNNRNEAH